MDGKTLQGASFPEKPDLTIIPDPLSTTRAAFSSSSAMVSV
jgi:hypothetical protein